MSIDRLPSGRYRVRVTAGVMANGKRRVLTRTLPEGATKKDAQRAELELQLRRMSTTGDGEPGTVLGLVDLWILRGDGKKAANTQYKYRGIVAKWLDGQPLATMPLGRVTAGDIDDHLHRILSDAPAEKRPEGTVGPATVVQLQAILKGSFGWAVKKNWLAASPANKSDPIAQKRSTIKAADLDQYAAALAVAENVQPGLRAYIRFLGATGCRRGEALAMRWNRIDGNTITIAESVAVVPGEGLIVKDTKTNRARKLLIGPKLLGDLDQLRDMQREVCSAAGLDLDPNGFCWSQNGIGQTPWRPDTAGKWVREAGVTPLMLRHMVATQLLAEGVSPASIQKKLGHSRLSTTLDVYTEALPADDQHSADILDGLAE